MYRFQHIEFLFGLALLPILVILYFGLIRWKKGRLKTIGDPVLARSLIKSYSPPLFLLKFLFFFLSMACLILGSANLQKPGKMDNVQRKGVDVMIALDVSKSMLAEDIKPSRLERAKQLVYRLMEKMDNDRIGLVLFAGRAYIQMPLTIDHSAAKMYIANARPDAVPSQGTVIGEALKVSNSAFNSKERKYKAIILISDGEDHDPQALALTKTLVQNGVMVNTVGVGSPEGVPILDRETNETRKDAQGNAIITRLNEPELAQLAKETSGIYVRLDDSNQAVDKLQAQLQSIEQKDLGDSAFIDYKSYFQLFLALGLLLLVIELFIPETKLATS